MQQPQDIILSAGIIDQFSTVSNDFTTHKKQLAALAHYRKPSSASGAFANSGNI
jgi:hypothetical protein